MNKFLCFIFLVFLCTQIHAVEIEQAWKKEIASLSEKEKSILEVFFRKLCSDSQAGYVLWGNKPLSVEGIVSEETPLRMLDNPLHRMSIYLKEGWKVWNGLKCTQKSKNYYIINCKKPAHSWLSLAVINKRAFIHVIVKNLPLFQYVLGPNVTAESLFKMAIDPSVNFLSDVLKDDKVLIGIVLGFGTQNALTQNRIELISDQQMLKVYPPFKAEIIKGNVFHEIPVKLTENSINELKPSFGYVSLTNESEDLEKRTKVTVDVYPELFPALPWFGFCLNSESDELLKHYLEVQPKIKSALESEHFLELVLTQFFEEEGQ